MLILRQTLIETGSHLFACQNTIPPHIQPLRSFFVINKDIDDTLAIFQQSLEYLYSEEFEDKKDIGVVLQKLYRQLGKIMGTDISRFFYQEWSIWKTSAKSLCRRKGSVERQSSSKKKIPMTIREFSEALENEDFVISDLMSDWFPSFPLLPSESTFEGKPVGLGLPTLRHQAFKKASLFEHLKPQECTLNIH